MSNKGNMSTNKIKRQPFPGGNLRNWLLVDYLLNKENKMKIKIFKGKLRFIHKIKKMAEEDGYVLSGANNNPKDECYEMIFDRKK